MKSVLFRAAEPHRLIVIAFALCLFFLLYSVLSNPSIAPEYAARLGATITFFFTAIVCIMFKAFLE